MSLGKFIALNENAICDYIDEHFGEPIHVNQLKEICAELGWVAE